MIFPGCPRRALACRLLARRRAAFTAGHGHLGVDGILITIRDGRYFIYHPPRTVYQSGCQSPPECGFSTCAGPGRYVHHRGCSFKIRAARFSPEVGATRMGRPSSACPPQCFPRHRARQICWDPLLSSYSPPRSGHSALTSMHSSPQTQQWSLPPLLRSRFFGSW